MASMIRPELQDDTLLSDIESVRRESDRLWIWWLGQSGYLVMWNGSGLLLDPYLSDSLTRKYQGTDKPHVRISERVVDPVRLRGIEVITSSHTHTDHLDADTLRPLVASNPALRMVCPEANRVTVRERSGLPDDRIRGLVLDAGGCRTEVGPFSFEAVPAAHESLDVDSKGRPIYLGFLIRVGPWTLYHSGDTVLFPGMAERLGLARIDIAFLPINGSLPERRVAGNLWGREAAQVARASGVRCVIPGHYDLFAFNTASPDEFGRTCRLLGQRHRVLRLGERAEATDLTGVP